MRFARASLVVSFAPLVLAAAGGTASTACDTCSEPALKATECSSAGGKFDREECACVGARPYYPAPTSTPTGCTSDFSCSAGRCRNGACSTSECVSDLDCRTEARCWQPANGEPSCKRACTDDVECPPAFACLEGVCQAPAPRTACEDAGACPRCAGPDGNVMTCSPPSECPGGELGLCQLVDFGACTQNAECRTSEGASCKGGRCFGAVRDAGADGS